MLAQVVVGYSLGQLAIIVVILLAVAALVMVATRAFGINLPPWLVHVVAIVVAALVIIFAIRIVMSM